MRCKVVWKQRRGSFWRVGLLPEGKEPAIFINSSEEPPEPGQEWAVPDELLTKTKPAAKPEDEPNIRLVALVMAVLATVDGQEVLAKAEEFLRWLREG